MKLPGVRFNTDVQLLQSELANGADYLNKSRPLKRLMSILEKEIGSPNTSSGDKSWTLDFLRSPSRIIPDSTNDTVKAIEYELNRLEGPAESRRAIGTGQYVTQDCGLVLRSIGYKSIAIEGIPFDESSGRVPNKYGKVLDGENEVGVVLRYVEKCNFGSPACTVVSGARLVYCWMVETWSDRRDCNDNERCLRNSRYFGS